MRKQTKMNSLLSGAIFTHAHIDIALTAQPLTAPHIGTAHWQLLGLPPSSPALPLSPGLLLSSGSISIHSPPARQPPGSLARPAAAPHPRSDHSHTSHLTVAAR